MQASPANSIRLGTPQERDLSRTMAGRMNHIEAAGDGQHLTRDQRLINQNRLNPLLEVEKELAHHMTK